MHHCPKFPFLVCKRCSLAHFASKQSFWQKLVKTTERSTWLENVHFGYLKGARFKCVICFYSFSLWEKFWANLVKNDRMIHFTWRFPFWRFESCSFLIWFLILLVLCIYFNLGKMFCGQNLSKKQKCLFNSKSFKLNVEMLKLLLAFILSYYSWHDFAFQLLFFFNAMYLLVWWIWL